MHSPTVHQRPTEPNRTQRHLRTFLAAAAIFAVVGLCGAGSLSANDRGECVAIHGQIHPVVGQGDQGIKAPATAEAGGTIEVSVGPNDTTIEVSMGGADDVKTYDIPSSKTVTISIPNAPGYVVSLAVGKGLAKKIVYVEIVAP